MVRRFLPLALIAASMVTVAFACMAMQPTHPSTTRPPPVSTTLPDTTTTSSSTTTTTTIAPTCDKCDDVVYKIPDPATTCGGPAFYCTDDDLLSRTLTGSCKTAACTNGKLFAYDSAGTPQSVTGDLACAFKTPAAFEDDSAPPVSFPNGASVFCKADTACQKCPAVEYTKKADNNPKPEEEFVEKPFLGKHGCPVKDCLRHQLRYEDQSAILHSITCNPVLPGNIDRNKMPVTKPVGCYDCGCSTDDDYSTLCPPGYFCQDYYNSVSDCKANCSPGDFFLTLMPDMPEGVLLPPEDVFCDLSNKWQPSNRDELVLSTCATPIDRMLTTQPVSAKCPPLEDLGGGNFSNVVYKSIVDQAGDQVIFAVCRNGMITSATSGTVSSFVYCDSDDTGWYTPYVNDDVTKVTCKPNSCVDYVLAKGYTQAQIDMINLVEETGRCRATCMNGLPFKNANGDILPKTLVIHYEAFEYVTDQGYDDTDTITC